MTAEPSQLQPMSMGELLDRAIRLYRKDFLTYVGIIAVVQVPIGIVSLVISLFAFVGTVTDPSEMFTPGYLAGLGGSLIVGIISFILVSGVATAATTRAISDSYLGEKIAISDAYRKINQVWGRLLWAVFLAVLLSIVLAIWFLVPCVGWLTGLGILFFYTAVVMPLIAPVVTLEGRGGWESIRRGWDLARRRFWWVAGFVFLLAIFAQLFITGPTTLVAFVLQLIFGNPLFAEDPQAVFTLQTIIQSVISLLFSLIYLPFQLITMTLLYFDLRVRTEGFDLAMLTQGAVSDSASLAQVLSEAPQPEKSSLVTGAEMGYFALLTVGVAAVAFILWLALIVLGIAMLSTGGLPAG